MTVVMPTMPLSGSTMFQMANQTETSSRAKPTTTRPMTAPERKATLRPSFSDSFTAKVVRADAFVAIFMPNQPHRPEKRPAIGTPTAVIFDWIPAKPSTSRIATSTMKTTKTTLYCRVRYAMAPLRTASAISTMFASPSERLITVRLKRNAAMRAAMAPAGPKT